MTKSSIAIRSESNIIRHLDNRNIILYILWCYGHLYNCVQRRRTTRFVYFILCYRNRRIAYIVCVSTRILHFHVLPVVWHPYLSETFSFERWEWYSFEETHSFGKHTRPRINIMHGNIHNYAREWSHPVMGSDVFYDILLEAYYTILRFFKTQTICTYIIYYT